MNEPETQTPHPEATQPEVAVAVPEAPYCDPIADTGGINLVPMPCIYNPRGSPFQIPSVGYFYISTRATTNVRRKWVVLSERLAALGIRVQLPAAAQLAPHQAIFTDSAQFPKWVHLESSLRGDAVRPGGYRIVANQDGVILFGSDEDGVQNAIATFLQLMEDGPYITGVEIDDFPLIPYRAVHLDMRGWPPSDEWLQQAIARLSSVKINMLILEYEANFDYRTVPNISAQGALNAENIKAFDGYAADWGITLVPLLSSVGNAEHILNHPDYVGLREHPNCAQMFNLADENVLNLLLAALAELRAVHGAKFIHIGGDGATLLGSNEATTKRAEALGGLDAVYLEHIGALCRVLAAENVQPLIWDEVLRAMTDEQLKWLPASAAFVCALTERIGAGQLNDLVALLQRYKMLGRAAWGSALVSPAEGYRAFDDLDAWGKLIESNLVGGFIASVRTRECSRGGLFPPMEAVWPGVLYAAERMWRGVHSTPRELFPQRFVTRFFGTRELDRQSRVWAGVDALIAGEPLRACQFFAYELPSLARNAHTAEFLESWSAVQTVLMLVQELEVRMRDNFYNIQNGSAEAFNTGQMRWRLEELKAKTPQVINRFSQHAAFVTDDESVHEYIESALAYCLRRIDELEPLLAPYELPAADLREPLPI